VQDIADALVLLLVGDLQGSINIGSGAPVRLREIAELLAEKSGRLDLLRLGALEASPDEAPLVVSDSTRLRKELGFHPAISIDQGLQSTLDWWRLHLASSAP
jgi:UDP-glucose 4-epimerase